MAAGVGRSQERLTLAAFVTSVLFAGGSAVAIRFSNRELEPLWGATLRFGLAALLLMTVVRVLGLELPRRRALVGAILFGLLQFGASFALLYYALVELHAGLTQTLLALVPLATLLLAVLHGQEKLHVGAIVGALLGIAGVALISGDALQRSISPLSLLAVLGSVICFAEAALLVRRYPPVHPVVMNGVGMLAGAALLLGGALLAGESLVIPEQPATLGAISYLVLVGSILVFLLYIYVLHRWAASRAAYGLVLIPFVTVLLSAWLDDEPIGPGLLLGGLLILTSVYFGVLRPAPEPSPSDEER